MTIRGPRSELETCVLREYDHTQNFACFAVNYQRTSIVKKYLQGSFFIINFYSIFDFFINYEKTALQTLCLVCSKFLQTLLMYNFFFLSYGICMIIFSFVYFMQAKEKCLKSHTMELTKFLKEFTIIVFLSM